MLAAVPLTPVAPATATVSTPSGHAALELEHRREARQRQGPRLRPPEAAAKAGKPASDPAPPPPPATVPATPEPLAPVVQPAAVVELTPVDPSASDSADADADQVVHGHGWGRGNGKGHRG